MKISIKREQFLQILRDVQGAVQPRSTIPILSHVKIEATPQDMRLTATDMGLSASEYLEIKTTTNAKITEDGAITAPARQLANILEQLGEKAEVLLESHGEDFLRIKAGSSEFNLRSLPVEDFPKVDEPKDATAFEVEAKSLRELFAKTAFSMSKDEIRYYLNGVYLHPVEEEGKKLLRAVATDGHRMALAQIACPKGADKLPSGIIPSKTVREFDRLFTNAKGSLKMEVSKTLVSFKMGSVSLVSRLVEGSFPDYGKVIPAKKGEAELKVDSATLAQMIDRVCAISEEPIKAVKMELTKGVMKLSVAAADNASSVDSMKADHSSDIAVGFNSQYLLDILRQEEGEMDISLNGDSKPTRISPKKSTDVLYILMPMRV